MVCPGAQVGSRAVSRVLCRAYVCMGGRAGQLLDPLLAHFQVRSRDISIEEWKDSDTYNPNTAYGETLPRSHLQELRTAFCGDPMTCSPAPAQRMESLGRLWNGQEAWWGWERGVQPLPSHRRGLPGASDGLRVPHLPQVLP